MLKLKTLIFTAALTVATLAPAAAASALGRLESQRDAPAGRLSAARHIAAPTSSVPNQRNALTRAMMPQAQDPHLHRRPDRRHPRPGRRGERARRLRPHETLLQDD